MAAGDVPFITCDSDNSAELLERVEVSDNPGSRPIRVMYTFRIRDEGAADDGDGDARIGPIHRSLSIYEHSYRDEPAVHRTYSSAYRHMLSYHCNHFHDRADDA